MTESKNLEHWFEVAWDDEFIYRNVSPPGQESWHDKFRWQDLIRVCFEALDYLHSDNIYFLTSKQPESYVVPTEAKGASALWFEVIKTGFFDAELAIKAATTGSGIYCWEKKQIDTTMPPENQWDARLYLQADGEHAPGDMPFKVFVDQNSHYQDQSNRYEHGEFESFETAVAACKLIIDQYLITAFKKGMSAAELYENYVTFGEDPFVVPIPEGAEFSAWVYAKQRCFEMCGAD
ncbi:MAG: hypothetical protein IAF02_15305 [Anaerolineae bacterium]|nr:hypothetical protein [Anaerolineae bacterium]